MDRQGTSTAIASSSSLLRIPLPELEIIPVSGFCVRDRGSNGGLILKRAADECAYARAGENDAGQIQRVGVGNFRMIFPAQIGTANGAQQIQRFRPGELFAGKTGDEAAAADFALCFFASQYGQKVAPWRRQRFSCHQIAEDNTPSQ